MADSVPAPPKPGAVKGKGIMNKKIGPVPVPIAVAIVAVVGFLLYRHYKGQTSTSGLASTSTISPDPNSIDPNTGLTYGAEEAAATGSVGSGASTLGSTDSGAGSTGGLQLSDLASLLSAFQGLGTTNYYYGGGANGAGDTPTNTTGAGNGSTSQASPSFQGGAFADPSAGGTMAPQSAAVAAQTGGSTGAPAAVVNSQPIQEVAANTQGLSTVGGNISAGLTEILNSNPPPGATTATKAQKETIASGSGAPASGSAKSGSLHALGGGL